MTEASSFLSRYRRFIPLAVTVAMFFLAYAFGAFHYDGMRSPQVFFNLFRTYPFLLVSAIGMTFVILTGGIDLSVSGVVALTTVVSAALLRAGWNPWLVIALMLAMGTLVGAIQGAFITFLKVQPFIATLAGMWVTRGLCFFISDDAISIHNRVFRLLSRTKVLIPGLSDPAARTGNFVSLLVLVALALLAIAIFLAHYTRFGRTVYAIGGNERSAKLMGLPVTSTKVLVYTFNGFCSGLAGLTLGIYVLSGHGLYAQSFEMDVIASVVMGGTPLSGGSGYVFGTLFGVLINVVIQTIIQFNGTLSSWWTKIVIGALTLAFIGAQSMLMARKSRREAVVTGDPEAARAARRKRLAMIGAGAALAVTVVAAVFLSRPAPSDEGTAGVDQPACQDKPFRQDQAAKLQKESGAVIVYERNGGPGCVDELFAIYPDGRIVTDDGAKKAEKQVAPAEVEAALAQITELGWFTDELYSTRHERCGECFGYFITVSHNGTAKTVQGVDGGTDAPAKYWEVAHVILGTIERGKDR